jgi:hypothetical protein
MPFSEFKLDLKKKPFTHTHTQFQWYIQQNVISRFEKNIEIHLAICMKKQAKK